MNKILENISAYFGQRDIKDYPGMAVNDDRTAHLHLFMIANSSSLFEESIRSRPINWKAL
jgi:hypothetical protein